MVVRSIGAHRGPRSLGLRPYVHAAWPVEWGSVGPAKQSQRPRNVDAHKQYQDLFAAVGHTLLRPTPAARMWLSRLVAVSPGTRCDAIMT